jgi:hypothetical protein
LIPQVWRMNAGEATDVTAKAIALRRTSGEGQEGLRAFLEKRTAGWAAQPAGRLSPQKDRR